MDVRDAIASRRSIKSFTDRAVTREEIEALLELAVAAPNHRLTEPVRFHVLGPAARRSYGEILGGRKAKKVADPVAARALIEKVAAAEQAVPAFIAVSMVVNENPEIREEDYATAMMAVQNLTPFQILRVRALDWKRPVISDFRCNLWKDARARFAAAPPALDPSWRNSDAVKFLYDEIMKVDGVALQPAQGGDCYAGQRLVEQRQRNREQPEGAVVDASLRSPAEPAHEDGIQVHREKGDDA